MKTQISRYNDFFKRNNYSAVYQQQGRMLTDADWNESVDILKQLVRDALLDTVSTGVPREGGLDLEIDGGQVKIRPGQLIIDGVRAQLQGDHGSLLGFDQQADLPGYPSLVPGSDSFIIYADVWERPVISLEEALLLDPGLYGADTCTRSQVMLQLKHAPFSADLNTALEDPSANDLNPRHGNAGFDLTLREGSIAADPCDPCEREVEYEAKSGNYLFRLEVHNFKDEGGAKELTLKWSFENGAEHYRLYRREQGSSGTEQFVIDVPAAFKRGKWVYDFFNQVTERHLGIHHADAFTPELRDLVDTFEVPTAISDSTNPLKAQEMVRRWDGYCVVRLDGTSKPTVAEGTDRSAPESGLQWEVDDAGLLTIQLETMVLSIQLSDVSGSDFNRRHFVAGDFWLALVRENSTQNVRVLNSTPLGVVHHYLKLRDVEAGALRELSNEELFQLSFPALTDLSADRVRYDTFAEAVRKRWDDIKEDTGNYPETVQEAIDQLLLNLESSDIRYQMRTDCDETDYNVPSLNKRLIDMFKALREDSSDPVRVKLDELWDLFLCEMDAGNLPYNPNTAMSRWQVINEYTEGEIGPTNVQDAIDSLANNLDSTDVPFAFQACASETKTIRDRLDESIASYDMDGDGVLSVRDILTTLLCRLDAGKIPYALDLGDETIQQLMVKKTGDTMTGALHVHNNIDLTGNLGVGGATGTAALSVFGGANIGAGADPGNGNLSVQGNCTIGQDIVINGNLEVKGSTSTINTETVAVEDNILQVNTYPPQASPKPINGGLEVFRGGTAQNARLIWDETDDLWKIGLGNDLHPINTSDSGMSSTGMVEFPKLVKGYTYYSGWINTGFGPGKIAVDAAYEYSNGLYRMGDTDFGRAVQVFSYVNPNNGYIYLYVRLSPDMGTTSMDNVRIRWWAYKAGMERPDLSILNTVTITPNGGSLLTGQSMDFNASVANTSSNSVTWSVVEANGGSISSSGLYTAPGTAGTYHVRATSVANPDASAQVTVAVAAPKDVEKIIKEIDKTLEKDIEKAVEKAIEKVKDLEILSPSAEKNALIREIKDVQEGADLIPTNDETVVTGDKSVFIRPEERPDLSMFKKGDNEH